MRQPATRAWIFVISLVWLLALLTATTRPTYGKQLKRNHKTAGDVFGNAADKIAGGQQTFRVDTFGDQAFWGDTLGLHKAIEGAALGGAGAGVSPQAAIASGLKIDIDALPNNLLAQIRRGAVDLKNPAVTVALLKLDAVVDRSRLEPAHTGGDLHRRLPGEPRA